MSKQADGEYISKDEVNKIINKWLSNPYYELKDNIFDMTKAIHKLPSVAIPSAEPTDNEDKIIRRTLENFMRGLWEEIQVGEIEYTTSEVYEMLEREIFTDNHVAIPSAEPCEDAISRQAALDAIGNVPDYDDGMVWEALSHAQRDVALLSPVKPQEPKTGHWIKMDEGFSPYKCSECGKIDFINSDFCPNCGIRMLETQKVRNEE